MLHYGADAHQESLVASLLLAPLATSVATSRSFAVNAAQYAARAE
jgi:hypothetical protein